MNYWKGKGLYQADWRRLIRLSTTPTERPCLRDFFSVAEVLLMERVCRKNAHVISIR